MGVKVDIAVTVDHVGNIENALKALVAKELYVGIPAEKGIRSEGPITNAALLYIHEHGAPEANIPARPSVNPTIKAHQDDLIVPMLKQAAVEAFEGMSPERTLSILGQKVADAIRSRIQAGIPPPLKDATIVARLRRLAEYQKAGSKKRKEMREVAIEEGATPLIDTTQMLKAITWVLRPRH